MKAKRMRRPRKEKPEKNEKMRKMVTGKPVGESVTPEIEAIGDRWQASRDLIYIFGVRVTRL